MRPNHFSLIVAFLVLTETALASTTWYVNGVGGSDSNNCTSSTTACKTIGHAISLARSGDSIMVVTATYLENLNIRKALKIRGALALTRQSSPRTPISLWFRSPHMLFFPN